jgi:hypothetical protein
MKLSVVVEAFTPLCRNTLRGFVVAIVPEMRMRIHDLSIHEQDGKRWVGLPAKPQIDRSGAVRKDARGKTLYVPILEFSDKVTRDAFSTRVVAAVLESFPNAFECKEREAA